MLGCGHSTAGDYAKQERFGLRKLGVMVSAVGKVFALDVNDGGALVWSHYLAGSADAAAGGGGSRSAPNRSREPLLALGSVPHANPRLCAFVFAAVHCRCWRAAWTTPSC